MRFISFCHVFIHYGEGKLSRHKPCEIVRSYWIEKGDRWVIRCLAVDRGQHLQTHRICIDPRSSVYWTLADSPPAHAQQQGEGNTIAGLIVKNKRTK